MSNENNKPLTEEQRRLMREGQKWLDLKEGFKFSFWFIVIMGGAWLLLALANSGLAAMNGWLGI